LGGQLYQGVKVLQCSRNWLHLSSGCYWWLDKTKTCSFT